MVISELSMLLLCGWTSCNGDWGLGVIYMSIEGIVSKFRDHIKAIGVYIGGPERAQRMNVLLNELIRRIWELENRDEMHREMMRAHTHTIMKEEVGYKPIIGKTG